MNALRQSERGAALVVGLFVALILLAIGALVVDVPRMERVGRLLQRSADAAALAGAAELNSEQCADTRSTSSPNMGQLLTCWLRAKRAVFYYLKENPVYTAEGVAIPVDGEELREHARTVYYTADPHDIADDGFDYEIFDFVLASGRTLTVQVTRMLYTQAQEKWSAEVLQAYPDFPGVELGSRMDATGTCPELSDDRCDDQPSYRWANGMHVRLTLDGFPSILAQLPAVGIPATTTIVRESFAAPHHQGTEWPSP